MRRFWSDPPATLTHCEAETGKYVPALRRIRRARASVCTRVLVSLSSDVCQTCVSQQLRGSSQALPFLWFFSLLVYKNNKQTSRSSNSLYVLQRASRADARVWSTVVDRSVFSFAAMLLQLAFAPPAVVSFALRNTFLPSVLSLTQCRHFKAGQQVVSLWANRKQHRRITSCICLLCLVLHLYVRAQIKQVLSMSTSKCNSGMHVMCQLSAWTTPLMSSRVIVDQMTRVRQ